jgi:type III restriction enzyme
MQAKEYQQKALERLDRYLVALKSTYSSSLKLKEFFRENPELESSTIDFTKQAWQKLAEQSDVGRSADYSPRRDGIGNPVPCITLKVPTGGGKTYLAIQSVTKIIEQYFSNDSAVLVLWIVPSEAIYTQTKLALEDQEHHLRKLLNIASGGRVQILDKNSPLHADDLRDKLSIMLLMLPSANRHDAVNKLKLFKDRGNINGFLPPDDDILAHQALVKTIPNLDYVDQGNLLGEAEEVGGTVGMVRASLGNALRMIQPLIVLDEGHKGFSDLAHKTLYGFNPRFVLELTATPKDGPDRKANWLVNITGTELEREQMIKLPIMLTVNPTEAWKDCLRDAWITTQGLQKHADSFRSNGGKYIRPILLVQVERTGSDQRTDEFIHAMDARDHLLGLGVNEDAIAIKTSDQDDLKTLDNRNLLEEKNPVRIIITKQALQEGWDCSFAYILCSLAVSRSTGAMTQLVGRILRQPYAEKTGVDELDQCYVHTFHAETGEVVNSIRAGLIGEGMGELAGKIIDTSQKTSSQEIVRERKFDLQKRKFYLPEVHIKDRSSIRPLDWENDILSAIPWTELKLIPGPDITKGQAELHGGVTAIGIDVVSGARAKQLRTDMNMTGFDRVFAVRTISEFIPNPWLAHDMVEAYLNELITQGWTEEELGQQQQYVLSNMNRTAAEIVELMAKEVFDQGLKNESIVFQLVADTWWEMPETSPVQVAQGSTKVRHKTDDSDLQKALFSPVYNHELNELELTVACFLDRQEAVWWWYRNVVRGNGYGLQGWKRNRIYPDFIVAQEKEGELSRWLVLETKGSHLAGNPDTIYKTELMEKLTTAYEDQKGIQVGQLKLLEGVVGYDLAMVAQDGWQSQVTILLKNQLNVD